MHETAEKFVQALHRLHAERDVDDLVALFADDATLRRGDQQHEESGADGVRKFWTDYREVFDDVRSEFRPTICDEQGAVLEWTSTGTLAGGAPVEYSGVSVLRGTEDAISDFSTYYDSRPFSTPTG